MGFVLSTIGKLFGSDNAAKSLIDNVSAGLDKIVYTGEEKADDNAKDVTEARSMIIEWLKATSGQNLSRRLIALTITSMWIFAKSVSLLLPVAVIWIPSIDAAKAHDTLVIVTENASDVTSAMMLVLGFYFAAPYVGNIATVALERFGKQK